MNRRRSKTFIVPLFMAVLMLISFAGLFGALVQPAKAEAAETDLGPAVYIIPVKQSVEAGMHSFLKRAFKEAEQANAEHVVLVINTLGGRVDSAEEIGHMIRSSHIPTTAFIEGKAVSAGTYIALNADQIVMQPGSTIGAAAVVDGSGELIDNPKTVSFWVKEMMEAAAMNGRDDQIAAAMVDPRVELSLQEQLGWVKKTGDILTLSATDAAKVGYSEHTAKTVDETIQWLGLEQRERVEMDPSLAENAARWLINPIVATVLLILGIAGVAIELIVPGFGAPGIVGILSFGLYFFGHYIAGFAGMEAVVLFVLGIALLIIEVFVPSFGILGILGSIALVAGIVIAAPDPVNAFISIGIALVISIVLIVITARMNKTKGIWNRFILRDKLTTEQGFLSADTKETLLGQEGVALTPLRPAGTVQIGDNRIDVVTGGGFIAAGRPVQVVKAEGTWVVVKEIDRVQ
jgi:membrane-bound serine protease (ClpP class)